MILIIDNSLKNAKTISNMFHYMGIISRAATPEQAVKIASNRYRAILLCSPEKLISADEYIRALRTYTLGTPVFALAKDKRAFEENNKHLFSLIDDVFYENAFSSTVYNSIVAYQRKNKLPLLGEYRLAGIDASIFRRDVTYYDEPIKFGKTETMMLRYLIRIYPNPSKPAAILGYAFKQTRVPEPSNIRTHISVMNKKFREMVGRNLIFYEPKRGYLILTPEMMARKNFEEKETITQ